ncbi:hypothetical protein V7R83_09845 [Lautropia mirabilis ATCC 51599]|jgi:hypothetical protein|uniref:Lipoprotein n=1 Tax=Lautropia mirabilis ATCC 51599 TaxID=887898 RepID=E7RXQ4_9BURK|nr:hypothetical protein [Lautropia mirabilis]EFV94728.1 hypothetical protein HMPREF0551_1475 [Lautropia mirabilis ATCC 51599]VEH01211.1 Uncharacterised protein [Lautropia mirabilis]
MTIPGNTYRLPLTAAALAILLAACGSGNGHDGSNADTKALSDTTPAATAKHATKADEAQAGDTAQANTAAQAGDAAQAADATQTTGAAQAAAAAPASSANAESAAAPATDASGTISSATAANRTAVADTAEASTVTQAAPQAAPISAAGVRGDALLTMLDQKGCLTLHQATSYNGTRVTTGKPLELPEPRADTDLNPNNYQKTTPNSPGLLSPFAALGNIICDTQYYQYHAAAPGEYSLSVGSGPHPRHQYLGEKILREFNNQSISASLTVTADSASLADAVSVGAGKPSIGGVGAPFSFRLDGVASYGLLKQWGSQVGNLAKLLLLKGDSDQQAKLCWNIEQPRARRLQCVVWQAPANWQRGQQLQVVDQYLIDDRSVYGEKGFVYWRGRFPQ